MTETAPATVARTPFGERRTVARLWHDAVAAASHDPPTSSQTRHGWREVSWAEAAERVDDFANGLLALGIRKGDAFAILAQTTLEWALFDLALAQIGAIGVADLREQLRRATPRTSSGTPSRSAVLCEDEEQLAKVNEHRDELPRLEHALTYADLAGLAARGTAYAARHPGRARGGARGGRARTTSSRSSTPRGRPGRRRAA